MYLVDDVEGAHSVVSEWCACGCRDELPVDDVDADVCNGSLRWGFDLLIFDVLQVDKRGRVFYGRLLIRHLVPVAVDVLKFGNFGIEFFSDLKKNLFHKKV